MHPFYDPSARMLAEHRTVRAGMWSMAAYLLFWAAAIPFALLVLKRMIGGRASTEPDPAAQLLRERLARGEIDVEEFERLRHVLTDR
ncbi:SHOCT domain-containing protein [Microbacter sp. GSS18]|nr:SHOCT domain-containing protein [Microbacter sp. GSS18]